MKPIWGKISDSSNTKGPHVKNLRWMIAPHFTCGMNTFRNFYVLFP